MPQAGYLLLERLKKYLRASPILKNPQKTRAYQFFKQIIFLRCLRQLFIYKFSGMDRADLHYFRFDYRDF